MITSLSDGDDDDGDGDDDDDAGERWKCASSKRVKWTFCVQAHITATCTLYTATLHCTICTAQCTLQVAQCNLTSLQYHLVHCKSTLHNVSCTVQPHITAHYRVHNVYSAHVALYYMLYHCSFCFCFVWFYWIELQ